MPAFDPADLRRIFSRQRDPGQPPPGLVPAGVLTPLFYKDSEPHLLFTQRTHLVKDHRGQISFPGGVRDPGDPDLRATALRETAEEIGLDPSQVEVWGTFRPVATVTGYWVAPFASLIPFPYAFRLNRREVERLLLLPLTGFLDPSRWRTGPYTYGDRTVLVSCWHGEDVVIWGATARLLLNFLACLGEHPLAPELVGNGDLEEG